MSYQLFKIRGQDRIYAVDLAANQAAHVPDLAALHRLGLQPIHPLDPADLADLELVDLETVTAGRPGASASGEEE